MYSLDPYLETLSLLCVTVNESRESLRNVMVDSLNAFTSNKGAECYKQVFPAWEQYVSAFMENRVDTDADDLLAHECSYQLMLHLHSVGTTDHLGACMDAAELQKQLLYGIYALTDRSIDVLNTEDAAQAVLLALDHNAIAESSKWALTKLALNPVENLKLIDDAIRRNMPAYEQARDMVKDRLTTLLEEFEDNAAGRQAAPLQRFWKTISPTAVLHPVFGAAVLELIFNDHCYYGLLLDGINNFTNRTKVTSIQTKLKVLGDPTKWEIINLLKAGPRYNTEIAEHLRISSPSASHNMSLLLNSGLVGVERSDGRVYYHLCKEEIEQMISDLEKYLLLKVDNGSP